MDAEVFSIYNVLRLLSFCFVLVFHCQQANNNNLIKTKETIISIQLECPLAILMLIYINLYILPDLIHDLKKYKVTNKNIVRYLQDFI